MDKRDPRHPEHNAVAWALREAGYKPAPRVWLTEEQMDLLMYMARQNGDDVNRIRAEARRDAEKQKEREIERAWRMMRDATQD